MAFTKKRRAEIAYEQISKWIRKIVYDFQREKGGDFDELLAEANYLFAVHFGNYDSKQSSLTYYMQQRIVWGLIDYKKKGWRKTVERLDELPEEAFGRYFRHWFLIDLFDEIGRDARMIVECLLQPDMQLMLLMDSRDGFRIERRSLREYLTEYRSWSMDRVDDAFYELQTAMRG